MEKLTQLDYLARNDFTLRLYAYANKDGYKVVFRTPGGETCRDCKTFGEATNLFAHLAKGHQMVDLDTF